MVRERIADDIYVFTSRRYAQVTAGAILTKEGVILIDTLFYPEETRAMRDFLETRLGHQIRYVINTHYHADHTMGSCLFPQADIVSHALCRQMLNKHGREGLDQMQSQTPEFEDAEVILPNIVFSEGTFTIHLGGKTVRLYHLPGHSDDLIGVFVVNDRILFASDTVMPVPTLFDGNYDRLVHSLETIMELAPDSVVQGHGEVILRGEVQRLIEDDLTYLRKIRGVVEKTIASELPAAALDDVTIESCGKSRIPLNGFVSQLHHANLNRLYEEITGSGKANH